MSLAEMFVHPLYCLITRCNSIMMPRQVEWSVLPRRSWNENTTQTHTHTYTLTCSTHQLFLKGGILALRCPKSTLCRGVTQARCYFKTWKKIHYVAYSAKLRLSLRKQSVKWLSIL